MDEFTVKLVVINKLKPEELVSAIHVAIREEADKLPKIPVLHFDFGSHFQGFYCSKQFADFKGELTNKIKLDRIKDIVNIKLFGKKCAEEYPIIEKMIKLYKHYDLNNTFKIISSITYLKNKLEHLEPNLSLVFETNEGYGNENIMELSNFDVCNRISSKNKIDISKFTKISLFEAIEYSKKTLNIQINDHLKNLGINLPIELMLDSFKHKYPEEIENGYWYEKVEPKRFTDALNLYGINNWKLWESYRKQFNYGAMRFLQEKPDVLTLPLNEDINVDLDIGLLFASSSICRLKVTTIAYVENRKLW
jgi:hypothetical protein